MRGTYFRGFHNQNDAWGLLYYKEYRGDNLANCVDPDGTCQEGPGFLPVSLLARNMILTKAWNRPRGFAGG